MSKTEITAPPDQMGRADFDHMRHSPMYKAWSEVAPDTNAFPNLIDKMGELLRHPYDWTAEVMHVEIPTLLVFGDADSIPPTHAAEFFNLLGGGRKDAGWDGSLKTHMQLAILPDTTHYTIFSSPQLARTVDGFVTSSQFDATRPPVGQAGTDHDSTSSVLENL
jgi:pimeloyl-ACP methyl ester carboxylesterase